MVPPKKLQSDIGNNGNKRDFNMPYNKRDSAMGGKVDNKGQNGARPGFRTDTAISNSRLGNERTLQPWVPDSSDGIDGSLEKSSSGGGAWDQFAENERLFGLKTDYDENIYTTAIDKSHPQYRERMAAAERKAREIERSMAATAHVAEERVMDFVGGGDGGDEEDKYSGVRRQDFPPLGSRENKYTPPAKRAPSSQTTVTGAPVDPAIISSQLRAPAKKQTTVKPEDAKLLSQLVNKGNAAPAAEAPKNADPKPAAKSPAPKPEPAKAPETKPSDTKVTAAKANDVKPADKTAAPTRPSAATTRTISPQVKEGAPSAASTVERDVLNSFKTFASQQRQNAEKVRHSKAKADKEVKLTELKKFADTFKLSTPVPTDLISIIAKDPSKQKEIQAKALQNAEEVARTKSGTATKAKETPAKEGAAKPAAETPATQAAPETRSASRPAPAQNTISPSNVPNRHPNARQSYASPQYHAQTYRNDRSGQNMGQQNRQPLAQRLRNVEQQKMSQPPNHQQMGGPDMRLPPTGPANSNEAPFARRISGVPSHMGGKLNPNSHEFRPSPFAASFNPNGHPSAGSSPRSSGANNVAEPTSNPAPSGQLVRRKTKAVDVKKCYILAHVKTFQPPQGRNWDENDGLRPSYDTPPTWRQVQDNEKPDSTMLMTSKEFLERQSFASSAITTPSHTHVVPNAHQHQLPFHLQQPAHGIGPRQSPHMPPMPMQNQHGGHVPHGPYQNMDDHRMMHSNSAQSFASPRMAQVPITYTPAMGSAAQVPYNQPMMQPFVGPGTPQMGGFRNFSNNHQYMPQQPGPMGGPMMPQFMNPQGMVPGPQMQMYPGGHAQFMPPNGAQPQPIPGSNGYPSPGRPAAPMMVHQGSQQGQPQYGMSPNVQYQQPAFTPQQPGGQVGNVRGYNSPGPQHFGTSPSQMHSYGPQHRGGNAGYGGKPFNSHGQHQPPQQGTSVPGRVADGSEEAK
ncbi:LsmAD domain-containing protein [Colletotrichum plurivorum]|uniref:LsmAD domain-containing protein n=1 Tax=Colletotrichum plurivorum TaxID=2175906 RepID=A0A8H6NNK5_9PEZI|nr:LsmAD domain-containing protein [Colletotrichum plurivorum]